MNEFSDNDAEPRKIKQFDADFYQAMIDTLNEGAFVIENKKFKLVNEAFVRMTGCTKRALVGQQFGSIIYPQDTPIAFENIASEPSIARLETPLLKNRLENNRAEYHLVVAHLSGKLIPIEINSQHFVDAKGQLYQIAYVKKKLVEQALNKALRSSENELQWLIDHLPSIYIQVNDKGNIVRASRYAEKLLGYEERKLVGQSLSRIVLDKASQAQVFSSIIQNKGDLTPLEIQLTSNDSAIRNLKLSGYAKNDKRGKLISIELFAEARVEPANPVISDPVPQQNREKPNKPLELKVVDVIRDPLTRLINQVAFAEHLSKSIRLARRHHSQLWVLYLNLQNIPSTDELFSEAVGNACLVQFSQRLQSFFRDTDTVARIDNSQFAVLLDDYTSDLSLDELIARLQEIMHKKAAIKQISGGFSFSIGTAKFPKDGISSRDLMEHAQTMMFKQQLSRDNTGS